MTRGFRLEVVSPEAMVWAGRAEMLVTRTTEGEIGVLAGHEPLMAALASGTTVITPVTGDRVRLSVHGGFLQVSGTQVTLLTDWAVQIEEPQSKSVAPGAAGVF
jgi:F-type H+-transporting ATPase subunit epsilon